MNLFLLTAFTTLAIAHCQSFHRPLFDDNSFEQGGNKLLEQSYGAHGQNHFGGGEEHASKAHAHHAHHNEGGHAAEKESGGKEGVVKTFHDKGSYSREKKYGYEKSYGYEKESKHHDKGANTKAFAEGYNKDASKGYHNSGAQSNQAHSNLGKSYQQGSQLGGNRGHLLDTSNQFIKAKKGFVPYGGHLGYIGGVRSYVKPYEFYRSNIGNSLGKFKYLSGIHGLGGPREYELERYMSSLQSPLGLYGPEFAWYKPFGSLEAELKMKSPMVYEGIGPDGKYYYFKSYVERSS